MIAATGASRAENLTKRVQGRQAGRYCRSSLAFREEIHVFPKLLFIADTMLRHGRVGRVSKSRWSFGRDTEEEVWVYTCLVDGSGKPLSTVHVNH